VEALGREEILAVLWLREGLLRYLGICGGKMLQVLHPQEEYE